MYYKHFEEISLPKSHSQACPATKHHPKREEFAKNEREKKFQTFLEGHASSKASESLG